MPAPYSLLVALAALMEDIDNKRTGELLSDKFTLMMMAAADPKFDITKAIVEIEDGAPPQVSSRVATWEGGWVGNVGTYTGTKGK